MLHFCVVYLVLLFLISFFTSFLFFVLFLYKIATQFNFFLLLFENPLFPFFSSFTRSYLPFISIHTYHLSSIRLKNLTSSRCYIP
eukprot:UN04382